MNNFINKQVNFIDQKYKLSIDNFCGIGEFLTMGQDLPDYMTNNLDWYKSKFNVPDILLSPGGMHSDLLTSFEHPAFLRIPDEKIDGLTEELKSHGIDPNRWFCVINYREPGYGTRPPRRFRDLNPAPFAALIRDIIENLGGQVIRVGHQKMTTFPKLEGFVDLAPVVNNFWLHAFAVSRARFMVGSLTGISHLGSAVNTPTLITNCTDSIYMPGCWRDHDLAVYLSLYDKNGRRISTWEQHESNFHRRSILAELVDTKGYRAYQNTPGELGAAVRRIMQGTSNCIRWRDPFTPGPKNPRPNVFHSPMPLRARVPIVEYPDLAARPADTSTC
jgi:putative glycosyltransferase (TIGR04372 family)